MASDAELLASLDRRLAILVKMEAYRLVKDMTIAEGAPILKRLGMTPAESADVFQTTAATVRVRLSEAKKKGAS